MVIFVKLFRLCMLLSIITICGKGQNIYFPYSMDELSLFPLESKITGFPRAIQTGTFVNNKLAITKVEIFDRQKRKVSEINLNWGADSHDEGASSTMNKFYFGGGVSYFFFDKKTNRINQIKTYTNKSVFYEERKFYYRGQKLIEIQFFNSNKKQIGMSKFAYNERQKEVIENSYSFEKDKTKPFEKSILNYNSHKQWSKKTVLDYDEQIKLIQTFEYNEKGLLKSETSSYNPNLQFIYEYEFDSVGNWIKRRHSFGQLLKNGEHRIDVGNDFDFRIISYY